MRNVLAYVNQRIESERAVELGVEVVRCRQRALKTLTRIEPLALALVEAPGADLVGLGSIGPEARPGMMIREEVENLVQRTSCSILAIKPAGFRSPVRLEDG